MHGRPAVLMVRPDCMRLEPEAGEQGAARVAVRVRDRSYLGDTVQYTVVTSWDQEIHVRMNVSHGQIAQWNCGDTASVAWDTSRGTTYQDLP